MLNVSTRMAEPKTFSSDQERVLNESFLKTSSSDAVKNKRESYHKPITRIFEIAKTHGVYWLTSKDVTDRLKLVGVIEHNNPRSIGDTLGSHEGGMNLEKRRVNGKMQYRMFKN